MRILLDENIPVQLRARLAPHVILSVNDPSVGWKNVRNGDLLSRMEGHFDVLITADQNIYAQQRLSGRSFSILVLPTNRKKVVLAFADRVAEAISLIGVGQYVVLDLSGETRSRPFSQQDD